MVNFVSLANTAERLIEENGRTLTLVRAGETAADPAMPWRADTTAGETRLDVIGVISEFKNEDFDGTLVRRGDKMALVAHNSVADEASGSDSVIIEEFDRLLDAGAEWKILGVEPIHPGSTRIMYILQLRK